VSDQEAIFQVYVVLMWCLLLRLVPHSSHLHQFLSLPIGAWSVGSGRWQHRPNSLWWLCLPRI